MSVTGTGPGGTANVTVSGDAFGIAGVGLAPVGNNLDLLAKLGLAFWSADATVSGPGVFAADSDDGTDIMFGLGAQWRAGDFSLRGEFERFDFDGTDVDMLSISAIFDF